tara:strand:- start:433 stop:591 length:159 start_codon:yes stop_codon:yes gene_type:complete
MKKNEEMKLAREARIIKENAHLYTTEENIFFMLDWEKRYTKHLLTNVKVPQD